MGKILLHSVRVGESVNYSARLSSPLAIRRDFHAYNPVKNCSPTPTTNRTPAVIQPSGCQIQKLGLQLSLPILKHSPSPQVHISCSGLNNHMGLLMSTNAPGSRSNLCNKVVEFCFLHFSLNWIKVSTFVTHGHETFCQIRTESTTPEARPLHEPNACTLHRSRA